LHDAQLSAECDGRTCITVEETKDPSAAVDVHEVGFATMSEQVTACQLVVRRRTNGATVGFEFSPTLFKENVFPLDGEIAKVQRCYTEYDDRHGERRARVVYLSSPDAYHSLAPARGNVAIPFGTNCDQLRLDGDWGAYAHEETDGRGFPTETVSVVVQGHGSPSVLHEGLRPGATFSWGAREATVVRIVVPHSPIVGWVEVSVR
jgi:hypothetical protein